MCKVATHYPLRITHYSYMIKAAVYNLEGKEIEKMELSSEVFGVTPKVDVLHQVVTGYLSNKRQPLAHTKTKGEVRGGGRKPWKQKGTGRARHGSSRSPIWVGGGITFGPRKERNYLVKINKKVKIGAMCMALSDKLNNNGVIIIDKMAIKEPKTKLVFGAVKNLFEKLGKEMKGKGLLVTDDNKDVKRASRNLEKIKNVRGADLNILETVGSDYLIFEKSAVVALEKRLNK